MNAQATNIAVLPFRNLSTNAEFDLFARGFVEDLTAELSRFPTLSVLASESIHGASAGSQQLDDHLADWNVAFVLEGSFRRLGETVRISVRLIERSGSRHLWADRFDTTMEELFDVQDRITAMVAAKLALRIEDQRLGAARRKSMPNLAAYECWLRGVDCLRQGSLEADEESRLFFQQALNLDPGYARAYTGLSLSHFNEWTCQAWHLWNESEQNAHDYATKAIELDDSDAVVHAVLGRLHLFRRRFDLADKHLERALSLNPNDPYVLIQIALAQGFNGQPQLALDLALKAMRLNPLHHGIYDGVAGLNLFMLGRNEEALPMLGKGAESVVLFPVYRAAAAALLGHTDRARQERDLYLTEFKNKITFGREPEPGEALRWAVQILPYRHDEDAARFADAARQSGLEASEAHCITKALEGNLVRPAGLERPSENNLFRKEGDVWNLAYAGEGARLVGVKGFHDIARLLARPGESVYCLELTGAPSTSDSGHELLDQQARMEYRNRIRELQNEIDLSETDKDSARVERARAEMDQLLEELSRATGLGGRSRKFSEPSERARTTVTWRVRSAIKKIGAAHPKLGQHFANSIRTGSFCIYTPEQPTVWSL